MKIIRVADAIHEKLMEIGKKGETFNNIIERLIENENTKR